MTDATTLENRKAEILRLGQEAVAHRGARRRARHHAVLMVALAAGATVLAITLAPKRINHEPPIALDESPRGITVARVATTAGLAASLAVEPKAAGIARPPSSPVRVARVEPSWPAIERVGDAEALALLREAGTPAGLIKVQGRVTLVYHKPPRADGPSSQAPAADAIRILAALPLVR